MQKVIVAKESMYIIIFFEKVSDDKKLISKQNRTQICHHTRITLFMICHRIKNYFLRAILSLMHPAFAEMKK